MPNCTTTLPTSEAFRAWAEKAIATLGIPVSCLMRDERDSSRNRASVGLYRNQSIKLDFARELEIELNEIARKQGVDIGTWKKVPRGKQEGEE